MTDTRIKIIILVSLCLLPVAFSACQSTAPDPVRQNAINRQNEALYQAQQQRMQSGQNTFNQMRQNAGPRR